MNTFIESRFGRALYEALPEVYRTRDGRADAGEGHLAAYFDACGKLLDAVYNSLDQRFRDCFPETCQEWLLPYFADLLGVSMLSPHVDGRREEIKRAISWRQGKGTLPTIKSIAEKIGGFENVVVREGWLRVARAARAQSGDDRFPSPAIADLRGKNSRDFAGHRNTAPHSVDVRKPSWRHGHAHQRSVSLYAPHYPGFFAGGDIVRFEWKHATINGAKDDVNSWFKTGSGSAAPGDYIELNFDRETGTLSFSKKTGVTEIVHIAGPNTGKRMKTLGEEFQYRFTEINLDDEINVTKGTCLTLEKLAAGKITVTGNADSNKSPSIPTFVAEDCLLKYVSARSSLARLVYCTILDQSIIDYLEASDCIFTEALYEGTGLNNPPRGNNGIRYCRHVQEERFGGFIGNTTEAPVFYTKEWGAPGCGVIHPASPKSICGGAEDGGEMGAFHHRAYVAAWEAATRKLLDYLPAGMLAALVPDTAPPENVQTP